jgi:osmotically-inducible protein OsmY
MHRTRLLILALLGALAAAGAYLLRRRQASGPPEGRSWPDPPGTLETEGRHVEDPDTARATEFPDDATTRDRVRSELLRDPEIPDGIAIDCALGVVTLRGEAPADMIDDIGTRVAVVDGVTGVDNRLHPPGTPAPG